MSDSDKTLKKKYGFEDLFKPDPLARKALRYMKNGKNLLDAGCGEGADSVFYAKKGFRVLSIDGNKVYLSRMRRYIRDKGITNISIKYGDVVSYPYRQNFFDAINCLLVGCCMKRSEFDKLVTRLKRTVKRSGIIIMSLRNYLDAEFIDYASSEKMIEPNTFRKKEECCKIRYYIEKNRLLELFKGFDILHYFEGFLPDKYKEVKEHGDSCIICRRP